MTRALVLQSDTSCIRFVVTHSTAANDCRPPSHNDGAQDLLLSVAFRGISSDPAVTAAPNLPATLRRLNATTWLWQPHSTALPPCLFFSAIPSINPCHGLAASVDPAVAQLGLVSPLGYGDDGIWLDGPLGILSRIELGWTWSAFFPPALDGELYLPWPHPIDRNQPSGSAAPDWYERSYPRHRLRSLVAALRARKDPYLRAGVPVTWVVPESPAPATILGLFLLAASTLPRPLQLVWPERPRSSKVRGALARFLQNIGASVRDAHFASSTVEDAAQVVSDLGVQPTEIKDLFCALNAQSAVLTKDLMSASLDIMSTTA